MSSIHANVRTTAQPIAIYGTQQFYEDSSLVNRKQMNISSNGSASSFGPNDEVVFYLNQADSAIDLDTSFISWPVRMLYDTQISNATASAGAAAHLPNQMPGLCTISYLEITSGDQVLYTCSNQHYFAGLLSAHVVERNELSKKYLGVYSDSEARGHVAFDEIPDGTGVVAAD
jgi:hypothetical protein